MKIVRLRLASYRLFIRAEPVGGFSGMVHQSSCKSVFGNSKFDRGFN